ncbi:MAG TPA: hypothetical protein VMY37_19975 [Thermoguttaceae bacterium]|nr:hypothetical protein [Thermoguttaceae bacterium]
MPDRRRGILLLGVACRMDHFSLRLPIGGTQPVRAMGRRFRRAIGLLAVLWAGLAPADTVPQPSPPAPASTERSEAAQPAQSYVEALFRRERLKAGNAFFERELERLEAALEQEAPRQDLLADLERIEPEAGEKLARLMQDNVAPLVEDLDAAVAELKRQADEAKADWLLVRTSLYEGRLRLFEVEASGRALGQLASLLSMDKRWFWLFGMVAIATLVGLVFHDRRHEIRRRLNGVRARKMGLSRFLTATLVALAVLTLITFFRGDQIYEALLTARLGEAASPRASILAQQAALDAETEALVEAREDLEDRHAQLQDAYRRELTGALPARSQMPVRWRQFRARALEATELAELLDMVPRVMQADLGELEVVNRELGARAEEATWYLRLRRWVRGGLGLALIGLAAAGGWLYRRGVEARRKLTANTCPLCLGANRLEQVPDYARRSGVPGNVDAVQCRNVISEEPYEECDYTFMDVYRPMTKLCFPTLGIPQAGKTHWLAMVYWELNRGNYPRSVQFEKIKSQSSEDFDLIVEEILTARIGTAATQRDRIPHPLVFNFRDRDRSGRSNVLVNIFDYSGEVTSDMGVEDYRRRRALDGDGFFFFLDPTYPSEPQAKALADFREDLRLVKGAKGGKRLCVPVALVVPKIDVLAGQSYASPDGGDAIARFYEELAEIDPTGETMSLTVIEARSRLCARLRDTIWPGWSIERQIHDLFGGRYLFFPLTPVGLDGRGETDLSLRTISPFALLEPLLWLLEMNGYPILQ